MAEAVEAADRDRSFDRLLTFVDAIVAIAITLLVLVVSAVRSEVKRHPELTDGSPYDGPLGGPPRPAAEESADDLMRARISAT